MGATNERDTAELSSALPDLTVVAKDGELRFEVHAKPRAKRTSIVGVRAHDGALEVALAAPPVDGAANAELVRALALALGVPKASVRIVRGEGSRTKLVAVRGLDEGELRARAVRAGGGG
jgi:uncharacterized protein (TIGR00251 family)